MCKTKNVDASNGENTKSRISDKITAFGFAAVMLALFICFLIIPDKSFSENENKSLQTMPDFSLQSLASGEFTSKMSDYCADQFPFRSTLLSLKAESELLMLKGENNGVIKGSDGYLISDIAKTDKDSVSENLGFFSSVADKYSLPVYIALSPRSADILKDYMPSGYPFGKLDDIWNAADSSFPENCVKIDLLSALSEKSDEYIYYKTDHHWTALGAYYAYREIASALGDSVHDISEFTVETASNDFYGTTWSFACIPGISPDTLCFYRSNGDDDYTVSVNGVLSHTGLYDRSYLSLKDKYSSYISSTTGGYIEITKNKDSSDSDRKTLILIKDSFSHSVAPFLAMDYDIIMIDTRYSTLKRGELSSLIEERNVSAILGIFGVSGLNDSSYEFYKLLDY